MNHWLDTHFPGALGDDPSDRLDLETALCHLVELGLAEMHRVDGDAAAPNSPDDEDAAYQAHTDPRTLYKAIPFDIALEAAYQAHRESMGEEGP